MFLHTRRCVVSSPRYPCAHKRNPPKLWLEIGRVRMVNANCSTYTNSVPCLSRPTFALLPCPSASYDLPIFGADLVSLPGVHLICIDLQPAHGSQKLSVETDAALEQLQRRVFAQERFVLLFSAAFFKLFVLCRSFGEISSCTSNSFYDVVRSGLNNDNDRLQDSFLNVLSALLTFGANRQRPMLSDWPRTHEV